MYEDYFGLDRPPFKITPDTSLFYEGGKRGDILGALVYAIQRGEGIIKVVGEVGSGKTMLCRMLQLKLPDTVEIVYIANPSVSPEDILFVIAHELALPVGKDASKHEVMHLLQDYLLQRHMENKQVVLFIEEAQGMPLETLEEIRLLSNLETDQNKLLQIILFGQPELDDNLSQQSIRQLRERITHNFNLAPLTQDEIHNYLNFRMREVGYTGPELINPSVAKKVEQYSEGLLRRINIIADKILLSAFAEGTHNLSPKHVTAAVNDSTFNQETPRGGGRYWLFGLIVAVALAFALFQTRSQWLPLLETAEMPAKRQNVAINDKPITDIATQVPETSETVPVEARDRAESQVDSAVVEEPPEAPLQQAQTVARLAESPGEQADANDQQSPAASPQTQSADDVRQETEVLMQQVEAVVQQVEAAVQQANIEVTPEPAPLEEDPVLQKALDQATSSAVLATEVGSDLSLDADYNQWLNTKLRQSLNWLSKADRNKVSIQVFVRSKSAARELVYYLRNEWPLDLSKTYLYEVNTDERGVYRVFYNEFDSLTQGRAQLERLPDSVKINSPYLHSVYRMQKALL
ncbi:MAG: AAA family ATPase [Gammaproteobacteria bacterium]|jgi:type II secretory pathway predicted ATPase ExeA|nr:AAA family ATPase [Gammaproteobacteria bacterium]